MRGRCVFCDARLEHADRVASRSCLRLERARLNRARLVRNRIMSELNETERWLRRSEETNE